MSVRDAAKRLLQNAEQETIPVLDDIRSVASAYLAATDLLNNEKRLHEMLLQLRDPDLRRIFAKFGVEPFRRSSVWDGLAPFVDKHGFRGESCVEIGTCGGLTAILLSRRFERVVSIDIFDNPWPEIIAEYLGVLDGRCPNVVFVRCKDNQEKAEVIHSLKFDGAYVDGDHTHDTETDFELVRGCGNVLFHEYWPAMPPVWDLVHRLWTVGQVVTEGKFALWRGP